MTLKEAFYESRFEVLFLRAKGNEFQSFFERLMGLAYKADFLACTPWGPQGDRKNDGFLPSERTLFQVYAPHEMRERATVEKIVADFEGAKTHWRAHFDKWVFVHNADRGLPPGVLERLLRLGAENPTLKLEAWGLEELRRVFRLLGPDDLVLWFGVAPDDRTKIALGFEEIRIVVEAIVARDPVPDSEVQPVPPRKLEANALSWARGTMLKSAMAKAPLVARFFEAWHDESLGGRLAGAFRAEYARLRGEGRSPNNIFDDLQVWAGGRDHQPPEHAMAILAVLAYYFERCDIFEEPKNLAP